MSKIVSGRALETLMPIWDIRTSMPSQPVAPRSPMTEPVMMARMGVLKNSSSPSTVDDLRQYKHERERRDEVGDLVVEQNGFEELPQKARRVQHDAEQDQGYDVFSRHYPVTTVRYMPGNPYWKTPSGTTWQWRLRVLRSSKRRVLRAERRCGTVSRCSPSGCRWCA